MTTNQRIPFLRSVLSEPNGSGSTARLCALLVVVAALLWVSYLVVHSKGIPPLGDLTVFVTSVTAALYGTNKIATAMVQAKVDAPCCTDPAPEKEPS